MLIALGLRCSMLFVWPQEWKTDPDGYLAHAEQLADGNGFVGPYSGRPTAYRPIGYPLLLVPGKWLGIPDGDWCGLMNVVAGVITVVLTIRLAARIGCSAPSALAAGGLIAADPLLLRYTPMPMTEVISAMLLTAAVCDWTASRSCLSDAGGHSNASGGAMRLIRSGILFGLAALVRPIAIIVIALLTAVEVARQLFRVVRCCRHPARQTAEPSEQVPPSASLRSPALAAVPALLAMCVLSPWMIRNAIQFGRLIPATTHGGYTLALGNNSDFYRDVVQRGGGAWDGAGLDAWQRRMLQQAVDDGVPPGDEPATDDWYYNQAHEAMTRQPGLFLAACGQRWMRFWSTRPELTASVPGVLVTALRVWYGMLWAGILLGTVPAVRSIIRWYVKPRRMESPYLPAWLVVVVVAFLLMHTVYWTNARMRAPLMPILAVLAVAGYESVSRLVCGSRKC
ncbi:MAG: hypothetical protein KDA96_01895 [Planctomycetaceae bacterium]|nr:hypothetical protein [Planctomycetaceae bacterium]